MKFPVAWAKIASENVTLKVVIFALSLCFIILLLTSAKLALRDPLIVERSCFSKSLNLAQAKPTQTEIEGFLKEALAMRFNSDVLLKKDFISISELGFREKEQDDLKTRQMKQTIIINSVQVNDDQAVIDSDRLISVGKVKSALFFPLKVSISTTTRTEANPYGLVLTKVSQLEQKGGESK